MPGNRRQRGLIAQPPAKKTARGSTAYTLRVYNYNLFSQKLSLRALERYAGANRGEPAALLSGSDGSGHIGDARLPER
jgi:hypothetical protein